MDIKLVEWFLRYQFETQDKGLEQLKKYRLIENKNETNQYITEYLHLPGDLDFRINELILP